MQSIKPGRGPSMMGAFGSAAVTVFGVIWTIMAMSMGAPVFFAFFGVIFVVIGIVQTVYNYKNATGKERFSEFDITDSAEEPDPLNEYFAGKRDSAARAGADSSRPSGDADGSAGAAGDNISFCPYCGDRVEGDFSYCPKCGKKLP